MKTLSSDRLPWDLQALLLMILLISNFFPFYITVTVMTVIFIILAVCGLFRPSFTDNSGVMAAFWIFIAYSISISLVYQNWLGVLISFGFAIYLIFFKYYFDSIKPYFVEDLINISLIASFILFIFALLEHFQFIQEWDYTFISEAMGKQHADRVEATFFNPNYYAMMLEFFIIIGFYKLTRTKKLRKKLAFAFITLCNLSAIFFTGARTSFMVVVGSIVVFYYVYGYHKQALISLGIMILAVVGLMLTDLFPRMDTLSWALGDRIHIWQTALRAIRHNYLFGQGPLTYLQVWNEYPGGKSTIHSHSIYLDPILSYGIVGCSILFLPFYRLASMIHTMRRYPALRLRLALICSFISIVLLHGLLDLTIFWIQTSFLFLIIVLPIKNMIQEAQAGQYPYS